MTTDDTFTGYVGDLSREALASINVHLVCDKHAPNTDRCQGSGYVCSAHRHTPPAPLVPGGCTCGAPVMACVVARTAPIVVRIHMGGIRYQEVLCTVSG